MPSFLVNIDQLTNIIFDKSDILSALEVTRKSLGNHLAAFINNMPIRAEIDRILFTPTPQTTHEEDPIKVQKFGELSVKSSPQMDSQSSKD